MCCSICHQRSNSQRFPHKGINRALSAAEKMASEQPNKTAGGAFGQFMIEKRPEFIKRLPGKAVSEVSKLGGRIWKSLPEADKEPYKKKYQEVMVNYAKDMAAFVAAGGVCAKGPAALRSEKRKAKEDSRKKKSAKDPFKPKSHAGGAFGCYLNKHRPAFMKECQGQPITVVTKLASTRWKALSGTDKAPFRGEVRYQEILLH